MVLAPSVHFCATDLVLDQSWIQILLLTLWVKGSLVVLPCWLNVPFPNQCILNLWFQKLQILKLVQKLLCFVISAIKIYIMRYLCITEGEGIWSFALYTLIRPLYLCISHALLHTVSGLLQVGVQELSSCFVEEVTVTRGTALCDTFCRHETLHNI